MPLSGSAFWAVLLPIDKHNLITNPSFEYGTSGWGTLSAGTLGTIAGTAQFGAWGGSYAPTALATAGFVSPPWTAANGSAYTISAYIRAQNGIPYRIAVADSAGVNFVSGGTLGFTGGGTWHRYSFSYTEPTGATRTLVTTKASDANTGVVYHDGWQVELGSLTTYVDGDQEGCLWLGDSHASRSWRSGTSRAGGSIVALADLGMKPNDALGAGMPPLETTSQSFALAPGAEFLNQRAAERSFVLTCKPISGTTQTDYHITRRRLIDALKVDLVDPQSPVRLWYTGGEGTVAIDAVLAGGFEAGERDGPMAEDVGIRFVAHDPFWFFTIDQGTALAPRTSIGSTNSICFRDPLGRWGTMNAAGNGTTVQAASPTVSYILPIDEGTVIVAGAWGTAGGTVSPAIARWNPTTGRWGTLQGGTLGVAGNAIVQTLLRSPSGTIYIGGLIDTFAGTAMRALGYWRNDSYGTLIGGSINGGFVSNLAYGGAGTLFFGGSFAGPIGGTSNKHMGMHLGPRYGTLTNGSADNETHAFVLTKDTKRLYIGGVFTTLGGTTANGVGFWQNGTFGTMDSGMSSPLILGMILGQDGMIYAGGTFTNASGGSANSVARFNGNSWLPLGSGVQLSGDTGVVQSFYQDPQSGMIWVAGLFGTAGGVTTGDGLALWNGYSWVLPDIDVARTNSGTFYAVARSADGTIYAGGKFQGTAQVASVAQVVNFGRTNTYPTTVFRNTSSGTARLFQLINTTLGAALYFNLVMLPGEEVVLASEPGKVTLTSNFRDNVFSSIIPGSNITAFRLQPGTNYISTFADNDSLTMRMYWRPRLWSFDGGTVY